MIGHSYIGNVEPWSKIFIIVFSCGFSYVYTEDLSNAPQFRVYWNVPTFMCHRHNMKFADISTKWGIIQNSNDTFRGEHMAILYDPGLFPALLPGDQGKLIRRNGGVPQEGNFSLHLSRLEQQIERYVPDQNFNGLGVLDFESWRPVFRQNWASLLPYREMSRNIEKKLHPHWSPSHIENEARSRFEKSARLFMEQTLKHVRLRRPFGKWGYYAFPFCYNYTPKNMASGCPAQVKHENDQIGWLFEASEAIFPSIYLSKYNMTEQQHVRFVTGRLNEAVRVARQLTKKVTVNPYLWYKYHDASDFLTKTDLFNSMAATRMFRAGGIIIWGSANDVNTKEKCIALANYIENILGPIAKYVTDTPESELFKFNEDIIVSEVTQVYLQDFWKSLDISDY